MVLPTQMCTQQQSYSFLCVDFVFCYMAESNIKSESSLMES